MERTDKDKPKPERGFIRALELITESIGWLQIVASPLLIGLIAGGIFYFSNPTSTRLLIGIAMAVIGLVIGIVWATKQWKGKGTIWFMSRIMATPELDKPEPGEENETTTKQNKKSNT